MNLTVSRSVRCRVASAGLAVGVLVGLVGCASYSRMMVDASGLSPGCEHGGVGPSAVRVAARGQVICERALEAAGFIPADEVGSIGMLDLTTDRGDVITASIEQGSAAHTAGIAVGDRLVAVDGHIVRDAALARKLLFGRAGSAVTVLMRRGDAVRQATLIRARPIRPST